MRKLLVPLLAVVLLFAAAPLCLAAPEAAGEHAPANPVVPDLTVAIATIVVFAVLLIVLSKTAWKPILEGLKAREEGIRSQIAAAEKANADAQALLADYQKRLATAAEEARSIVEEGKRDAEAQRARMEADAKAEAQRERERSRRDIDLAKDAALKEIYDRVATLSTDIASKILQTRLDPAQHKKLVDDAVTSYERSRKAPGARG
jgi:F-type H+-transporting ATPase subunit b